MASALCLALLPGTSAQAQDACANGAINLVTGNYVHGKGDQPVPGPEICVSVQIQVADGDVQGAWEEVAGICDLWSDAQAYEVMFKIGQCGLIVPVFEGVGQFYGASVPIRMQAAFR
jgi:hypothetical protein